MNYQRRNQHKTVIAITTNINSTGRQQYERQAAPLVWCYWTFFFFLTFNALSSPPSFSLSNQQFYPRRNNAKN